MNMKRHKWMSIGCFFILVIMTGLNSCQPQPEIHPPVAKVIPEQLEKHEDIRIDNYYWLRERENQEVIDYLEAENAYTDAIMAHTEELQEKIYEEIVGRIKETDISVPVKKDDYYY